MLYHDSYDAEYRDPIGPVPAGASVTIRFLCDEAEHVTLRTWDGGEARYPMQQTREHLFETTISVPEKPMLFWYDFIIHRPGGDARYGTSYDQLGGVGACYDGQPSSYQITVYDPAYQTPEFLRRAVVYQIFPDRFFRDEKAGHPGRSRKIKAAHPETVFHKKWDEAPFLDPDPVTGDNRALDFFGGTLRGIAEKLDELQELGVTVLYLNPIFRARTNHRYDTGDYAEIDPILGDRKAFDGLIRAAKARGMRVMLDGVFSHTGSDSRYFNREGRYGEGGAYRDPNSPYRSWYDFDPKYKGGYRSWWGFETLPEVNEETPSFVEFITGEGGVIDTWLRRGAAGFRLDVADELPDEFIEKIRTAVKRVSPEKFLLGEVWEDATTKFGFDHRRTYLLGKGLDSVMNYPFKNSVLDFVKGKPAQQAANEILSICEHYPAPAINTALNFLSTHDTERALTVIADEPANGRGREWQSGRSVTGEAYEEGMLRLRMAYAIIYTLPGVPCLYYGDEIGMQGYRDPFNRAFFCWDSHEERLRPVLAQLAQLRHSCEAFRTGELRVLRAEDGILHYQRIGKTETAEIIVNRSEHIIVEPLASGKHTEVNPMGFTIVVEENGHNPNHSYYDIQ